MTTYRRIALDAAGRYFEYVAAAALSPGHLLEVTSAGTVQKHSVEGGRTLRLFATEDSLEAKTVSDAYASGSPVRTFRALPGDRLAAMLQVNQNVAIGDPLVSAGDGTLIKLLANGSGKLYSAVAASAAITNKTDETLFDKFYSIPANFLRAGDILRVRAQVIATATNSTDTLTVKLYIGGLTGTAIVSSGAVDVADNGICYIDAELVIRTIGATGTFVATGTVGLGAEGTVTAKPFKLASTAIDTTAAKVLGVGATWSAASESNSCRLDVLDVEIVRAQPWEVVGEAREALNLTVANSVDSLVKIEVQ